MSKMRSARTLVVVFGDQLSDDLPPFQAFDKDRDAVWMAEAEEEASYVWSHKKRLVLFFSAMRHFRDQLRKDGVAVHYTALTPRRSEDRGRGFPELLEKDLRGIEPGRVVCTRPGDWRVLEMLKAATEKASVPLEVLEDNFFYKTPADFQAWAVKRKALVMENFYRMMRTRHGILLEGDGKPVGGGWNFDRENRQPFKSKGPGRTKSPRSFSLDAVTREVTDLVDRRFSGHPGSTDGFDLPVARGQAEALLRDFIETRLEHFGTFEDAMWSGRPFLYHSRLSTSLNLHLLTPAECVDAAVRAHDAGRAPINSVEGFVRQVLGWREFVHGVYWRCMPGYAEKNALSCDIDQVPSCYWDGAAHMNCLAQSMKMLLDHGYAHHIHRLMVFGNCALLAGVHPHAFHRWHMAMYCDAVDWVSLPNTLGMSQFGDGGIVATKPYCASGNYINRMSDFCKGCRYRYADALGENACPITTLYYDFLDRHKDRFADNRRMALQYKNLDRKSKHDMKAVRKKAEAVRRGLFSEGGI